MDGQDSSKQKSEALPKRHTGAAEAVRNRQPPGKAAEPRAAREHEQGDESTPPKQHDSRADTGSDKTAASPKRHIKAPFSARRARRRAKRTDNGREQSAASAEEGKRRNFGITGKVVTALIGFIFGLASNQAADFIKRADECSAALSQYAISSATEFASLSDTRHAPSSSADDRDASAAKLDTDIITPWDTAKNKCPVDGRPEYLKSRDLDAWKKNHHDMTEGCFNAAQCDPGTAYSIGQNAYDLSHPLIQQANEVSKWGLAHRGWYAITHLW